MGLLGLLIMVLIFLIVLSFFYIVNRRLGTRLEILRNEEPTFHIFKVIFVIGHIIFFLIIILSLSFILIEYCGRLIYNFLYSHAVVIGAISAIILVIITIIRMIFRYIEQQIGEYMEMIVRIILGIGRGIIRIIRIEDTELFIYNKLLINTKKLKNELDEVLL